MEICILLKHHSRHHIGDVGPHLPVLIHVALVADQNLVYGNVRVLRESNRRVTAGKRGKGTDKPKTSELCTKKPKKGRRTRVANGPRRR